MTHRYHHPIKVTQAYGHPTRFVWRNTRYVVAEVLATWHLQDRWWQPATPGVDPATRASDRQYYRVRCADQQTFDLYCDVAQGCWVLDCVHD